MKIGITGGNGFIGWHLRCYLQSLNSFEEIRIADRQVFADKGSLATFVTELNVIVHLAGVNRADDDELLSGNIRPAEELVDSLHQVGSNAQIIYSSSTYAETGESCYGKGKSRAGDILREWSSYNNSVFTHLIIPHVFGEYGRPNYNSGVATFCHQIINDLEMTVNAAGNLELIHVQDLVEQVEVAFGQKSSQKIRVRGKHITVGEVVSKLQALKAEYIGENRLPDLSQKFTRDLFNSLRGFIPNDRRVVHPVKHADERGWLVETVKAESTGQCFVSTTKPGITRGNHYHRRKVERFFVLKGKGKISLRQLFTDKLIEYDMDGNLPSYIDIPTLHTHKITNSGSEELVTLFWSDEHFDPENSDTFPESV